jgi:hypothetical protein
MEDEKCGRKAVSLSGKEKGAAAFTAVCGAESALKVTQGI